MCREFYNVLFTGVRVMIEGGSIVNQYFGPQGFGYVTTITTKKLYIIFLQAQLSACSDLGSLNS